MYYISMDLFRQALQTNGKFLSNFKLFFELLAENRTRTSDDQHKWLPQLACQYPTPLLFEKSVVIQKIIPKCTLKDLSNDVSHTYSNRKNNWRRGIQYTSLVTLERRHTNIFKRIERREYWSKSNISIYSS